VLINDRRRYRGICFRISAEERATAERLQGEAIDRDEKLMGLIPSSPQGSP
jgi:hypothetical protein